MTTKHILIFFFTTSTFISYGQELKQKEETHIHHKNHIGVANSPVYFLNGNQFAYGFHMHYVHNILDSKFGVGLGYEHIFGSRSHNTFGIVAGYRPIDQISLNIAPGVTFESGSSTPIFTTHFETSYEFEFKYFHIGPVFEYAYEKGDPHLSLGLHLEVGF